LGLIVPRTMGLVKAAADSSMRIGDAHSADFAAAATYRQKSLTDFPYLV